MIDLGFHEDEVFHTGRACTLPGWFRPTKDWDLLALDDGELVSAIELKSISSSFGNNANNRAEESIGSVVDAIEAYNERLYGNCSIPPVMGYATAYVGRACITRYGSYSRVLTKVSLTSRIHP